MAVVKNLMTRAGFDASGMRKGVRQAQAELNGFKKNVSKTMRTIGATIATIGVGFSIKNATKEAMGFEASLQQINRLMGENAIAFNKWAKQNASSFNMARSEATKYGAVFANLISGFTSGTQQTTQYTQDLLKSAAVISSSTGRTIEDTMDRIRSGMLGSTEAIEDLGINVNVAMIEATDAFKRFANGKSWQQLDFQTQQTVRYFAILEQAATKYGLELANNTSSRQGKFIAQLKNAQLALGQAFLPIYNVILPALTKFATALANIMNTVAQFTQALFGGGQTTQVKQTESQASAVSDLGNAYAKAGKQAKSAVSGFDQVNLIGGTSGSAEDAAGGIIPDQTETAGAFTGVTEGMEEVSTKAQEMAARVKQYFGEMKDFIVKNKEPIIASLAGISAALATLFLINNWGTIINGLKSIGTALRALISPAGLVVAAIAALVAGFIYFYRTNEEFRGFVDGILLKIGEMATWLWQSVLVPFGEWLGSVFVAVWHVVGTAATWLWDNVLAPLGNFLLWLWQNVFVPVGGVLIDVLGVAFRTVADIARSFWQNVLVPLGKALSEMFKPAVEAVSAVLGVLWNKVLKPFGEYLSSKLKKELSVITDAFVYMWQKVLKPLAEFVGGAFKTVFNNAFIAIGGIINGAKKVFIGFMDFIAGTFTGNWKRAWEGIKGITFGIFDAIGSVFKGVINTIIDALNWLIRQMNKLSFDMPDWLPDWAGGGKTFGINIKEIPRLAKGGLAYGPTLSWVGDNPGASHDPEVIAPLSKLEGIIGKDDNSEVVSVLKAILQAVKSSGNGDKMTMSKTELGRAATAGLNDITRRTGKTAFNV